MFSLVRVPMPLCGNLQVTANTFCDAQTPLEKKTVFLTGQSQGTKPD